MGSSPSVTNRTVTNRTETKRTETKRTETERHNTDDGEYEKSLSAFHTRQKMFDSVQLDLEYLYKYIDKSAADVSVSIRTAKAIYNLYHSYYRMEGEPFKHVIAFRKKVTDEMIQQKTVEILYHLFINPCKNELTTDEEIVEFIVTILLNTTDYSDEIKVKVAQSQDFMHALLRTISSFKNAHFESELQKHGRIVLSSSLGIIHNVSLSEDLVNALRKVNTYEILKPYLKSEDDVIKLCALSTLANIVTENECDILATDNALMTLLIASLQGALQNNERRYHIGYHIGSGHNWSAKELAVCVRQLARNDKNKKSLVSNGVLPVLVKLAEIGDIAEQREAVGALWSLSFDKENQEIMVNNTDYKVIETFHRLMSSSDNKIKEICRKALWTMRESLMNSEKYRALGEQFMKIGHTNEDRDEENHVMISYNKSHRPIASDIYNNLTKRDIKVWMDIHDMHGSTVDAMAKAVENAKVVLICYSPQYKNSDNCRSEAEYALKRKKKVVFLKMAKEYEPDGWLGLMLGMAMFYDFSGKYQFEDKFNDLLKVITQEFNKTLEEIPTTKTDLKPVVEMSVNAASHPKVSQSQIRAVKEWTETELTNWLDEHSLPRKYFKNWKGIDVAFLCVLMSECPEIFYQTLREQIGIKDFHVMARLRFALDGLNISM